MRPVLLDDRYDITAQDPTNLGWTVPEIYSHVQDFLKGKAADGYAIGKPDADDAYCFHFETPFWVVYFSERGKRVDPCFFRNWIEAAEVFARMALGRSSVPLLIDWRR